MADNSEAPTKVKPRILPQELRRVIFLPFKVNSHFMKKIPKGAEASNILVGEVDFLEKPFSAFIRLQEAAILGDLTEVPVPTRFLFIMLGPCVSQIALKIY